MHDFPCVRGQYFLSSLSTPSDLDNVEARAYSLGYEGAPSISPRSPTTLLHSPLSLSADMDPLWYFVRDELYRCAPDHRA